MKENSFLESLVCLAVKFFGLFISLLPMSVALFIGRMLGRLAYLFDVKRRRVAYDNLRIAFADSKSPKDIKRILKRSFICFGENVIELFLIPRIVKNGFENVATFEGAKNVEEALSHNRGIVYLTFHSGNWEIANLVGGMLKYPYNVVANVQNRYLKLAKLLDSYRKLPGTQVISPGFGGREIIKRLKNNEIVTLVYDQGGKSGRLVKFFNKTASMSVGGIKLGLKHDVPMCFASIVRLENGKNKVFISEEIEAEKTGDFDRDVGNNLQKVTNFLEGHIRKYPEEYLWFYKIWKYSDERTALILHDGKTGHLRQSQTVAEILKKNLTEKNTKLNLHEVQIVFKSEIVGKLFALLSGIMGLLRLKGGVNILSLFLTKKSFKEIFSFKADYVISCGSQTAGSNYLMSHENSAKSIFVLKPGLLGYGLFDLVVLPKHDQSGKLKDVKNIVFTRAAPNLIKTEYLKEQSTLLINRFRHLKHGSKKRIGLLLGGDTKNMKITANYVKLVVNQLKQVCVEMNAEILVSTSRRTSKKVDHMLNSEFKKDKDCSLLILANQNNVPEAVGGILGLSDFIVVSGDSISMVSEALTSGKPTVVFMGHLTRNVVLDKCKHHVFIEGLVREGYLLSSDIKNVSQSIFNIAKNKVRLKKIKDFDVLFKAINKVS